MAETRRFTVNPAIIRHLISSQAGTLEKAFGECVMNSIDAGASKVEISLDNDGFVVMDDGCGFKTREEVLACFEVFGFEHTDKSRVFGQFGLGRAQLWNWASTIWSTHQFRLDVDIRARGLDYELADNLDDVPGMTIGGGFYERLPEAERQSCIRGLERMCKYSVIPVFINGRNIQHDPATAKWQYEDENCWIRKSDGWGVDIYNQGILVRSYSSSEIGISGAIVTKRGKVLAVSMSRTDVLTQTCKLWPKIKAAAAKLVDVEVKSGKSRLTDEKRDFLAQATINPDGCDGFMDLKVFTLSNGRHESLSALLYKLIRTDDMILTTAPHGDKVAERAMRDGLAVVLAPRTLSRFDAESVSALVDCLIERLGASSLRENWQFQRINEIRDRVYESLDDSPIKSVLRAEVVPTHEWKPMHRAMISALNLVNGPAAYAVASQTGTENPARALVVGESNAAEAFTDGSTFVAIETEALDKAIHDGLPGMLRLVGIIVHEYLHNDDDSGSHIHDQEFYESFHEVMLDSADSLYARCLEAFRFYCKRVEKINARLAKQADVVAMSAAQA